jgi:hypothetical protein
MLAVHNFSNGGSKDKVDEDGQPLQKTSCVMQVIVINSASRFGIYFHLFLRKLALLA